MTKFLNIDLDPNLGGDTSSDVLVSSQKAIKTYVDTKIPEKVSDLINDTGFITKDSNINGNAESASKLKTGRTITLTGGVTGNNKFDGSSDISIEATVDASKHKHLLKEIVTNRDGTYSTSLNSLDIISGAYIGSARSSKTFGLPAEQIEVEYSRDNGVTWTDYELDDSDKFLLFSEEKTNVYLGKGSDKANNTVNNQLRITISPWKADGSEEREVRLSSVYLYVSTNNNTLSCKLERSTIGNPDTYTTVFTNQSIQGYPGPNIIYFPTGSFGGSSTQTTNNFKYRLTFTQSTANSSYPSVSIQNIRFLGPESYLSPNNIVSFDRLYKVNQNFDATFPANVIADSFIGTATKAVSDATGNTIIDTYATKTEIANKQDLLVSGTNIKTINHQSLLGSGNIDVSSGGTDLPDQTGNAGKFLTTDGTSVSWATVNAAIWGNITGNLIDQKDLSDALALKANKSDLTSLATKTELTTETNARSEADKTLQTNINNVSTDLTNEIDRAKGVESGLDTRVTTIEGKIPEAATSTNQLADKDFVNSSIANMAAHYITSDASGSSNFASVTALLVGPYYYGGQEHQPEKNDYAVVEADENHIDSITGEKPTTRYICTSTGTPVNWSYQYTVNKSTFTSDQWKAINSKATLENIAQIAVNTNDITSHKADVNNPHKVTKDQVGLGNVDNTSDADKPVSTATGTAIKTVSDSVSSLETRVSTNEDDIAMNKDEIGTLTTDMSTAKTDITNLKTSVNSQATLISDLQDSKQDKITDLDTIRSGAAAGATAVQPAAIADMETKTNAAETYQPKGDYATSTELATKADTTTVNTELAKKQDKLVSGTNIKTVNGETLLGAGDIQIASGGGAMPVGAIFSTPRTGTIEGAVEANGGEYNIADYSGEGSIGALLTAGSIVYVSKTEFQTQVANTGACGSFGWNGAGKTLYAWADKKQPSTLIYTDTQNPTTSSELFEANGTNITDSKWIIDVASDYSEIQTQDERSHDYTYSRDSANDIAGTDPTFLVPKLDGVYIVGATENIGDILPEQLPNIKGSITAVGWAAVDGGPTATGFASATASGARADNHGSGSGGGTVDFDASRSSSAYTDNGVVRPKSVQYRVMVQLATGATDEALETCTSVLSDVSALKLGVAGLKDGSGFSVNGKKTIVRWGLPDYTAGVSIPDATHSGTEYTTWYTATADGVIMGSLKRNTAGTSYLAVGEQEIQEYGSQRGGDVFAINITVCAGDVLSFKNNVGTGTATNCTFFPFKGAQ